MIPITETNRLMRDRMADDYRMGLGELLGTVRMDRHADVLREDVKMLAQH